MKLVDAVVKGVGEVVQRAFVELLDHDLGVNLGFVLVSRLQEVKELVHSFFVVGTVGHANQLVKDLAPEDHLAQVQRCRISFRFSLVQGVVNGRHRGQRRDGERHHVREANAQRTRAEGSVHEAVKETASDDGPDAAIEIHHCIAETAGEDGVRVFALNHPEQRVRVSVPHACKQEGSQLPLQQTYVEVGGCGLELLQLTLRR